MFGFEPDAKVQTRVICLFMWLDSLCPLLRSALGGSGGEAPQSIPGLVANCLRRNIIGRRTCSFLSWGLNAKLDIAKSLSSG
jgi:hypothetical protein